MSETVLVAMSGGVDSSVAALLLVEQGFRVVGVTLRLFDACGDPRARSCCALEDAFDAGAVAKRLGIEHRILEHQEAFERLVIQPFVEAYAAGRTPNPCITCNERVKFGSLWDYAKAEGFDFIATGHHARLVPVSGGVQLRRGADADKDQSYVLFPLGDELRRRTLLPVGGWLKADLRERARSAGLPTADKPESQDICFVGGGSYAEFVGRRLPNAPPGPLRHVDGRELGRHGGVHRFTVGQRRGLGVPASEPLYVTAIDPVTGEVTVGPRAATTAARFRVERWLWHAPPQEHGAEGEIQVRYRQPPRPARFIEGEGSVVVEFLAEPQAVTPGQAAVAYRGDVVLGGGWIQGRMA